MQSYGCTVMKQRYFANLFLLGYLVLFLNFGPSWHRAPIFGLHDHPTTSDETASCNCGCDHSAGESDQTNKSALELPECDCAVCHFFKQYHVTCDCPPVVAANPVVTKAIGSQGICVARVFWLKRARGPPCV
jgi:hypothetical protein